VENIVVTGVVTPEADRADIAGWQAESPAEGDQGISIFRTGSSPAAQDSWSWIPAANRFKVIAQMID